MGHDGLAGARAIHAAHGRVLVQDEASSVVWGMPGAIARAGLAHAVLPLTLLPGEIPARSRARAERRAA
jgi:two-component system chemotaxis response regulator CheB